MLELTANEYKQNMQFSLLPSNKIDTVNQEPIINKVDTDPSDIHTETFTTVNVGSSSLTLPINNNVTPTHSRKIRNYRWVNLIAGNKELAKGRLECVMASGSKQITLTNALQGTPTARVQLVGTSEIITRGGSAYDNYPTYDQLNDNNFSLAEWIASNKVEHKDYLSWDYDTDNFKFNPFIRNYVPITEYQSVTYNDILTTWYDNNSGGPGANDWTETVSFGRNQPKVRMAPVGGDISQQIQLRNLSLNIYVSITKIDDFNVNVVWKAPVRIAYAAASRRYNVVGTQTQIDNYAILDNITQVNIIISGQAFSEDTQEMSISLKEDWSTYNVIDSLTNEPSNVYPYDISKSTAFTTDTTGLMYIRDVATTLTAGVINTTDGSISPSNVYKVTDFITYDGSNYSISGEGFYNIYDTDPPDDNAFVVACYDKDKNFIKTVKASGDNKFAYIFSIEGDVRYIRINTIANAEFFKVVDLARFYQYTSAPWNLLTKYIKGKYIVKCDISAKFILRNNIRVGTQTIIKQQDNTYINRNGIKSIFEVKNIEKRFEGSQFVYTLTLLEV